MSCKITVFRADTFGVWQLPPTALVLRPQVKKRETCGGQSYREPLSCVSSEFGKGSRRFLILRVAKPFIMDSEAYQETEMTTEMVTDDAMMAM
jgi:hypothetical protein